jgi:hypothetical protein
MLCFANEYRTAIENMTSERKNDLRQFELEEEEWAIAEELCNTLKVRVCNVTVGLLNYSTLSDTQGRNSFLLAWNSQPADRDPGHGSHRLSVY